MQKEGRVTGEVRLEVDESLDDPSWSWDMVGLITAVSRMIRTVGVAAYRTFKFVIAMGFRVFRISMQR